MFRILYRTIENPEQKETKKNKRENKKEKENARHEKFYENSAEQQIATQEYCHGESKEASLRRRRQQQRQRQPPIVAFIASHFHLVSLASFIRRRQRATLLRWKLSPIVAIFWPLLLLFAAESNQIESQP